MESTSRLDGREAAGVAAGMARRGGRKMEGKSQVFRRTRRASAAPRDRAPRAPVEATHEEEESWSPLGPVTLESVPKLRHRPSGGRSGGAA